MCLKVQFQLKRQKKTHIAALFFQSVIFFFASLLFCLLNHTVGYTQIFVVNN